MAAVGGAGNGPDPDAPLVLPRARGVPIVAAGGLDACVAGVDALAVAVVVTVDIVVAAGVAADDACLGGGGGSGPSTNRFNGRAACACGPGSTRTGAGDRPSSKSTDTRADDSALDGEWPSSRTSCCSVGASTNVITVDRRM